MVQEVRCKCEVKVNFAQNYINLDDSAKGLASFCSENLSKYSNWPLKALTLPLISLHKAARFTTRADGMEAWREEASDDGAGGPADRIRTSRSIWSQNRRQKQGTPFLK